MGFPTFGVAALFGAAALAGCAGVADSVNAPDRPGRIALLAEQRFEFNRERESIAVSPALAAANAIGVRPLNGDAECQRVVANFANGDSMDLPIESGILSAGGIYWMALPEGEQNLMGIEMFCGPVRPGVRVDMQVLATTENVPRA